MATTDITIDTIHETVGSEGIVTAARRGRRVVSRRRPAIRCAPGAVERATQAAVGVLLAAFAIDSLADPPLALLAALGAAILVVGAIRGWCPGGLLAQRAAAVAAREPVEEPPGR